MPSLHKLQADFAGAVFSGGDHVDVLLAHCGGDRGRAAQGLEAYRRSVLANLGVAVQATYPVLEAIVGKEFLAAAARRYAMERPSTSGDLNAYGGDFDDFLARYEPAAALPYLPDVARLEWLVQQVYGAKDVPAQDFGILAATPPDRWGELRFRLDPAHACLESAWPLARIWEVNQPGYAGDFEVEFDRPQTVLIHRRPGGTAVEALNPGELDFLRTLGAGQTLAAAVDAAAQFETFELQTCMQRCIAVGLLRQVY
ncbi:MAG: DNA-binding domain-containing protein [Proteobacteria bacterium]|nr:DNA-binding domain-containing protein [Pseudomonadota bacterium]